MNHQPSSIFSASFSDDGFVTTASEPWFKVKVQLIQQYFQSFVTHVSERVEDIVFVDLYSGSGLYSIGHQKELFAATSLASLEHQVPVSKWIFCEGSTESAHALKIRVKKYFRSKNVVILESKPEHLIDKFRYYVPQSKGTYKVAVFCVVDPFSIDIPFAMLSQLTELGFSFLVPYAFSLNNRLDYKFYLRDQKERLKKYVGGCNDLSAFDDIKSNQEFYKRLVRMHQNSMLMLGLNTSLSAHKLDSGLMEMPLYYMGFYSRQLATNTIQRDIRKSLHAQIQLF